MFTGIIEHHGTITQLDLGPDSGRLCVRTHGLPAPPIVSASIAVNGCCLTVVEAKGDTFRADLSGETIRKTSFRHLKQGDRVNLEQPLTAGKEFGGHFVLGHVDTIGHVAYLEKEGEGWRYGAEIPHEFARYIVRKGSVTIDGISLTVATWDGRVVEIAVIPYTYEHTNIQYRKNGDPVNLEGDVLGKYVERYLAARDSAAAESAISVEQLIRQGF
jgi:riboflavin synthase